MSWAEDILNPPRELPEQDINSSSVVEQFLSTITPTSWEEDEYPIFGCIPETSGYVMGIDLKESDIKENIVFGGFARPMFSNDLYRLYRYPDTEFSVSCDYDTSGPYTQYQAEARALRIFKDKLKDVEISKNCTPFKTYKLSIVTH